VDDRHELIDDAGSFNLASWREVVDLAVAECVDDGTVICPFGFEITQDPQYLRRDLQRFYVYVSTGGRPSRSYDVGRLVSLRLAGHLRESYPRFYSSIGHFSWPDGPGRSNDVGPRLVQVRILNSSLSMLDEYACYLVAAPFAIINSELKEIREFDWNPAARRYVFQLAVIYIALFEAVPAPLHEKMSKLLSSIARLNRADFSGQPGPASKTTADEVNILVDVVFPYMHRITAYLSKPSCESTCGRLSALDIHSGERFSPLVNHDRTVAAVLEVQRRYNEYPNCLSE
jgi:hypothetical protein